MTGLIKSEEKREEKQRDADGRDAGWKQGKRYDAFAATGYGVRLLVVVLGQAGLAWVAGRDAPLSPAGGDGPGWLGRWGNRLFSSCGGGAVLRRMEPLTRCGEVLSLGAWEARRRKVYGREDQKPRWWQL